ncbi:MAG: metal ABC transporter substrate-binding protein [Alphaproteobacteria bacterium]|nr:metal ABC transporter substrate-binding protein [Alphaproteobacteria bacterium]
MRLIRFILIPMLVVFSSPAFAAEKLNVVASFSVIGDMVKQIGRDDVVVKTLVGPNMDAHTYQPTPADARMLADADLVFVNGLGFEGWIDRMVQASGYKGKVVVLSEGIAPRMIDKNEIDPHAWQNLLNGKIYVANIAKALKAALPEKAGQIDYRAAVYSAEMERLNQLIVDDFAAIPAARRKIITNHEAFGYFGDAYGIVFVSPIGMNTEAEPSASDVAKLINQIKSEGVKLVFIENMSNPKLIKQIAKDAGAEMGGELFSDSLSLPGGPASTYLDMFQSNVDKMKGALIGK